jgi:AcrR family transcriptional regulator
MRVTAQVKEETRARILEGAGDLFRKRGFAAVTTRELAGRAGIAAGTLFNYFHTKHDVALALVEEALEQAEADFRSRRRPGAGTAELLFGLVVAQMRRLEPYRKLAGPVLWDSFGPSPTSPPRAERLRARLESALDVIFGGQLSPLDLQLFWSLYLGVLEVWSRDESPRQEDSLALLDRSLVLFCESVAPPAGPAASRGGIDR